LQSSAGCDSILNLDLTIITIQPQTVQATTTDLCPGNAGTTLSIPTSEIGINYTLYDAVADTVVNGPIVGTGGQLDFSTGNLTSSTTFKVIGKNLTPGSGSAVAFDGVDDYLSLAITPQNYLSGPEMGEAWIYLNSYGNGGTIIEFGQWSQFFYDSIGRLHWAVDAGNWGGVYDYYDTLGATIPLNQWVNVGFSYNYLNTAKLYINGVIQEANTSIYYPHTVPSDVMAIGGSPINLNRGGPVDGKIDELALMYTYGYNFIYPEAEDLSCIDPSNSNLLLYLNFEEGLGNMAFDTINGLDTFVMQNMNVATAWQQGYQCGTCSIEMANQVTVSVNANSSSTDVITACDSYQWLDGNTYTASNNTATFVTTNAAGCDSTITLDLTINTVDVSVTNNSPTLEANLSGATYQWIDC